MWWKGFRAAVAGGRVVALVVFALAPAVAQPTEAETHARPLIETTPAEGASEDSEPRPAKPASSPDRAEVPKEGNSKSATPAGEASEAGTTSPDSSEPSVAGTEAEPAAPGAAAGATPGPAPRESDGPPAPKAKLSPPARSPVAPGAPKVVTREALLETARQIRELLGGTLAKETDPRSLFDLDLADEQAIDVEAKRLLELLSAVDALAASPSAPDQERQGVAQEPLASALGLAEDASASSAPPDEEPGSAGKTPAPAPAEPSLADLVRARKVSPELWEARIALDRARLAFYGLPAQRRMALLAAHKESQIVSADERTQASLSAADLDADRAEKAKQEALLAARRARSEAERAVYEEQARLLEVKKRQANFDKELIVRLDDIKHRHDEVLGRRRTLLSLIARPVSSQAEVFAVDDAHDRATRLLAEIRERLAAAIRRLTSAHSPVPHAGPDLLASLPADVDRSMVTLARKEIEGRRRELERREDDLLHEEARLLMAELEMLNRARLELVPHLSPAKRAQVTGFGTSGLRQAKSETRQVWLTLRYHFLATESWISAIREGTGRGESAVVAFLLALKWFVPIGLLILWRRRAPEVLAEWREALKESFRKKNQQRSVFMSRRLRLFDFFERVRRPGEWLLLLWSVHALLPEEMRGLVEIQLLATVLWWTLGGALVVAALDALSSPEMRGPSRRLSVAGATPQLRLRSLRLIGRAVVTLGLILSLSDKLVGRGTVYSWVISTCWFAALPILLIIIRWWRPIIYERIGRARKKTPLQRWVLSKDKGLLSFAAAVVGGAHLFLAGIYRVLRSWVVTFTVVRRLLAYLFRRGMTRKAQEARPVNYRPLEAEKLERLGPESASEESVASVADKQIEEVIRQIQRRGGGVFAIIGERGLGKTTTLRRIAATGAELSFVECPRGGVEQLLAAVKAQIGAGSDVDIEAALGAWDARPGDSAILIDDAQRLVLPTMNGLEDFDAVLDLARRYSRAMTWLFSFDKALWPFFERARGARPLFDDVIQLRSWSEEAIVSLINHRNELANIDPSFEQLVLQLPDDADEIDMMEALENTEAAYYRLLWDYADGNPAVALHFWRGCLRVDEEGVVRVRAFSAPDADSLEELPDSAIFVLRAIVQIGVATASQIQAATGLPRNQVVDVLRHGVMRGHFVESEERYEITWDWLRAITRYLSRKHLLSMGGAR